ncbi:MAG: sugar phosphate isomerase/epimerase [Acidobacteria bacterium]|nr:MAG: sugar phosphate isomerase/epimerase [Acidobacteriota bacterium]
MKLISRREFGTSLSLTLGAVAFSARTVLGKKAPSSMVHGVQIGIQSYSFRDRAFEQAIDAIVEVGINSCELWQGHLEPKDLKGEALRKWRLDTPLSFFEEAGKKLKDAGIQLSAYNYSFRKEMTDAEIEQGFLMAKALGTHVITASSNPSMAKRVDQFAQKHKLKVGMHNHAQGGRADEYDGPKEFAAAMAEASPYICINLDIGHFVAAGFDPVDYISKHHDRIVTLHIKDRKKGLGPESPTLKFGTGGTPIKEVLQLLKREKYKIPANIEHEVEGQPAMEGVKESLEYCKQALA